MLERLVKLLMVASLALFTAIVVFNNLTDYGANFAFVRHVLSMDTVFPDGALSYRAITNPLWWHVGYGLIIGVEGATCAALTIATIELARNLRRESAAFRRSKRFVHVGVGIGFLLWFTGFMVMGGEWFAMWQSKLWNGQEAAFRFYMTMLGVLIIVAQDEKGERW